MPGTASTPSAASSAGEGDVVGDGRLEKDIERAFGRRDVVADGLERGAEHVALVLVGRGVDASSSAVSSMTHCQIAGALMKPRMRLAKAQAPRSSALPSSRGERAR